MPTTIHHTTIKSAAKQGVILELDGMLVHARIPANGTVAFGVSGPDALKQVLAAQEIFTKSSENTRYRPHSESPKTRGFLEKNGKSGTPEPSLVEGTPVELLALWEAGTIEWDDEPTAEQVARLKTFDKIEDTFDEDPEPKPVVDDRPVTKRNEQGVALDGAVAYREGITAADCPYSSEEGDDPEEYDNFVRWNEEWDAAADANEEEEGEGKGGSVVKSKYRTKYKEMGHPTHCGDWLADLLNNYCIGDKHTDLVTFERICGLNGVDTSKYRREGVGWQGRIRMTGRNLLAKKVFSVGKITVPNSDGGDDVVLDAPADWIAAQRYNKPEGK